MAYTHTTFVALKTQLSARLSDKNGAFWIPDELGDYIIEAMRVFGTLTGFWRGQGALTTSAGVSIRDITKASGNLTAMLGYTVTDRSLVKTIQYHFLEPASGNSWAGTSMYTLDDVTRALQQRRDQFLAETGVVITSGNTVLSGPPDSRVALADTIIDIRRLLWFRTSDSTAHHLWREDEHNMTAFDQSWGTAGNPPIAYSVSATPPITVQLMPPASVAGILTHHHVAAGAALDPTASQGVILGIPDDLAWVIKWGAMADLLSHGGEARDPRAEFCEKMFKMGVAAARDMKTLIHADIGGTPILPDSVHNLDAYRTNWSNGVQGTPDLVATQGQNFILMSPTPDGAHTVTLDVVRKADIPTSDADNIEMGREDLNGILDYAEHLAAFKIGGAEFNLTQQQASNFLSHAVLRNQLMEAGTRGSLANMFAISKRETEADRPRRTPSGQ